MEVNILIDKKEQKRLISMLKGIKFDSFEIDDINHFYRKGKPRHGLDLDTIKRIYYQFGSIIDVFKRKDKKGFKYTFVYKINNKKTYKLVFRLDQRPKAIVTAYYWGTNIGKKLLRSYGLRL